MTQQHNSLPIKPRDPVVDATIMLLTEKWPSAFFMFEQRRRPLKVGIHIDVLAALDGLVTEKELARAMRFYVGNPFYLQRMTAGADRIDLNGVAVGVVTEEQAAVAARILASRKSKCLASSKASRSPSLAPKPVVVSVAPLSPPRLSLADLKRAA